MEKKTASELSHLIAEARLIAGITQKELADRMGVTQPTIARAERGIQEPSVSFLKRVAESVNVDLVFPHFRCKDWTPTQYVNMRLKIPTQTVTAPEVE